MKTEANQPAFSKAAFYHPDGGFDSPQEGLTIREYFAAMAMQGYIAAGSNGMPDPISIAGYAIQTADALINALNEAQ